MDGQIERDEGNFELIVTVQSESSWATWQLGFGLLCAS
jgi:hypothetical protein